MKGNSKFVRPEQHGGKGKPHGGYGGGSSSKSKKFCQPEQYGTKGKPHGKGFPGTPAPKD